MKTYMPSDLKYWNYREASESYHWVGFKLDCLYHSSPTEWVACYEDHNMSLGIHPNAEEAIEACRKMAQLILDVNDYTREVVAPRQQKQMENQKNEEVNDYRHPWDDTDRNR